MRWTWWPSPVLDCIGFVKSNMSLRAGLVGAALQTASAVEN